MLVMDGVLRGTVLFIELEVSVGGSFKKSKEG